MCNVLTLSVYRKKGNKAALVFRRNRMLYRITTIENARHIIKELNVYGSELLKQQATPKYILKMLCPGNRIRVLEIGLQSKNAYLNVWDLNGPLTKCCFKWEGAVEQLTDAFKSVFAFH